MLLQASLPLILSLEWPLDVAGFHVSCLLSTSLLIANLNSPNRCGDLLSVRTSTRRRREGVKGMELKHLANHAVGPFGALILHSMSQFIIYMLLLSLSSGMHVIKSAFAF